METVDGRLAHNQRVEIFIQFFNYFEAVKCVLSWEPRLGGAPDNSSQGKVESPLSRGRGVVGGGARETGKRSHRARGLAPISNKMIDVVSPELVGKLPKVCSFRGRYQCVILTKERLTRQLPAELPAFRSGRLSATSGWISR